jgi:hypothetical protein
VEWLAFGLIAIAVVILFFGAEYFKQPLSSDDRTDAIWRAGFAWLAAVFMAARVAAVGFSLFLIKRVLRFKPRALLWVISLIGATLGIVTFIVGAISVCVGIGMARFLACDFGLSFLSPILIVLSAVLLVRTMQSSVQ